MKRWATVIICLAVTLAAPTDLAWASQSPPTQVVVKKATTKATGKLKVVLRGSGTYTVVGKGVRRVGTRTAVFIVPVGRYTVRITGATTAPKKVTVGKKGMKRVRVRGVREPAASVLELVSARQDGVQGKGDSHGGTWSPDGTRIAFASEAATLVSGDTNGTQDIFVKQLSTGTLTRVSTDSAGGQGNGYCLNPAWAPDGRRLAFVSRSQNLAGDGDRSSFSLFVKDLVTGAVQRINTTPDGAQTISLSGPEWSPDGTRIALNRQLVDKSVQAVMVHLGTQTATLIASSAEGQAADGWSANPSWSPDGTRIAFAFRQQGQYLLSSDTNDKLSIYVKTLSTGAVQRVSVTAAGEDPPGWWNTAVPQWSPNGTRLALWTRADFMQAGDASRQGLIYVKDLATGALTLVTATAEGIPGNAAAGTDFDWSPDGRSIAFSSQASNLGPNDGPMSDDVFIKNLSTGAVTRVSVDAYGNPANWTSWGPQWAPDGKRIAFTSDSTNLVPNDTNGNDWDVFVRTLP